MAYTMYRCFDCGRLTLDKFLREGKPCKCGSRKVRGAVPSNIFEHIKVIWWGFTVR